MATTAADIAEIVHGCYSITQVEALSLPPAFGKSTDARAAAFTQRHGALVQVELDAVPPDVLERLYREALEVWWDRSTYDDQRARELRHVDALNHALEGMQ